MRRSRPGHSLAHSPQEAWRNVEFLPVLFVCKKLSLHIPPPAPALEDSTLLTLRGKQSSPLLSAANGHGLGGSQYTRAGSHPSCTTANPTTCSGTWKMGRSYPKCWGRHLATQDMRLELLAAGSDLAQPRLLQASGVKSGRR